MPTLILNKRPSNFFSIWTNI